MAASLFDLKDEDPGRVFWRGYTVDHGIEAARADFVRRFGVEPERMIEGPSILLVGPVPAGGAGIRPGATQDT